ncbi:MAG: methyl-accepting chemotaxis protein [Thiomicrospira sp.]
MDYLNRIKISTRVGLGLALSIALVMFVLTWLFLAQFNATIHKEEQGRALSQYNNMLVSLQAQAQSAADMAILLANSEEVLQAMQRIDRERLSDMYLSTFASLKKDYGFTQLHFHGADNVTILRAHSPKNHSDDLTKRRPDVAKVNAEKKTYMGLALGKSGLGIRGVVPAFYNGQHIGAVELGRGFNERFVEDFKANYHVDAVFHLKRDEGFELYNRTTDSLLNETSLNQAFSGEAVLVHAMQNEAPVLVLAQQIVDSLGKPIGVIELIMDNRQNVANTQAVYQAIALAALLALVFLGLMLFALNRTVARPLKQMVSTIHQVADNAQFNRQLPTFGTDEIGDIALALNQLFSKTHQALTEANHTVSALAQGDCAKRMLGDYQGDLLTLKTGINRSSESVETTMHELAKRMQHLANGDFAYQSNFQAQGVYQRILQDAEQAMQQIETTITDINRVMDKVQQGQFTQRVEVQAQGELNTLKQRINSSVDVLALAIQDIARVVNAQSQGDLTQKITADYHGDLRTLEDAINASSQKLLQTVNDTLNSSEVVSRMSAEITRGAQDLSHRVQQQAAALEQTSATMDEMNSAVQNNTQNARQVAEVARNVQNKTRQGASVMQQTIASMNAIQQSSHKIAEIVSLIDGIAFQTNLLALNAAVEAARAGDHGRGFAVVAGEVRALAQKSAEAAKDIKHLIDESVGRINEGTQLADQSGEMLNGVHTSIEEVVTMIEHIAQASQQQAQGVGQVHQAITNIDQVTQQNAALVEETTASTESLTQEADNLRQNMAFFQTHVNQKRLN